MNNEIIVAFHVGRGGFFNNSNHKSFLGEYTLQDLISKAIDENKCWCDTEDIDGNVLDDDKWTLEDEGKILLEGRAAMESNVGTLDFDGEYDTDYAKHLDDCTECEWWVLLNALRKHSSMSHELANEIRNYFGLDD